MPNIDVLDLENNKVGTLELDEAVWAAPARRYLLTEIVNWQRASRRSGTQCAKTKAEVNGTTKKPYKQKGTGNARQGSTMNPHMVGGGVAFAPKPRDYAYAMPKAKRRAALATALSLKLKEGGLRVVRDFELAEGKTRNVAAALQKLAANTALIVDGDNESLKRGARNLESARYLHHAGLNVYDLLKYRSLVITESAVKAVQERLLGETSES